MFRNFCCCYPRSHGLSYRMKLMVTRNLLDQMIPILLEQDEMPDIIQKQLSVEEPFNHRLHLKLQFGSRSEEHTSELQSRGHLVCRLLLEKKNKTQKKAEASGPSSDTTHTQRKMEASGRRTRFRTTRTARRRRCRAARYVWCGAWRTESTL